MVEGPYDFAVLGSTPLASLLAGLLGGTHRRRVLLVAEPHSPLRPARGLDLAVAPLTRPETWAMLHRSTPELQKLLAGLGKGLFLRLDPLFEAETSDGADALAHMRHVARGFDYTVERMPGRDTVAYRFQDVPVLDRPRLAGASAGWLQRGGVNVLTPTGAQVTVSRDGSALINTADGTLEAAHVILADDAAIITYAGSNLPAGAHVASTTVILTEPAATLSSRLTLRADSGMAFRQQHPGGPIWVSAPGSPGEALARIGAALAPHGSVRPAARARFDVVVTSDGAPLVGRGRALQATLIAGLGVSGAFLAPALARFVAGSASEVEAHYFAAREPGKDRSGVADYLPVTLAQVAA